MLTSIHLSFQITVDIVDLVGLHLVMSRTSGKAEVKFLVAGVGWATAELIMTRFIPLWVSELMLVGQQLN